MSDNIKEQQQPHETQQLITPSSVLPIIDNNITKSLPPSPSINNNTITSAKKQAARRTLRLAIPKLQQQHAAATESMQFAKQRNDVTKLIQNERKVNSARLGRTLHSDGSTGSGECSVDGEIKSGGPLTNNSLPDMNNTAFTFINNSPEMTTKGIHLNRTLMGYLLIYFFCVILQIVHQFIRIS